MLDKVKALENKAISLKFYDKEIVDYIESELTTLYGEIRNLPIEDKKIVGEGLNRIKDIVKRLDKNEKVVQLLPPLDITAPFSSRSKLYSTKENSNVRGSINPLYIELDNILRVFEKMGFQVLESRQLDDDYHMFESLNFPKGHPARDLWDTFWTEEGLIPPAHTSTMQNRVLRSKEPPIRFVIPGTCYRNEATDASHEHTLFQIEGVYVDKNISVGDMIGTIKAYLGVFFETDIEVLLMMGYFPFTEPSAEVSMSCPFCHRTGCSTCGYKGWIEIMGCGMIHPAVLKEAGIDPTVYSGFAWGFGLDRLVMIKNGIKEVRIFRSEDIDFLSRFTA